MNEGIGGRFQRETKYTRTTVRGAPPDWTAKPAPYKTYPGARRQELGQPSTEGGPAFWSLVAARRSIRTYRSGPLSLAELSQLLWAAQGITRRIPGYELRTSPSAGALYPVETYLAAQAVEGLGPGVYHYDVRGHALEQVRAGDVREALAEAALFQNFTEAAGAVFIWTAVFPRSKWKYRERAHRYVYLDAGHIAQNLALAAVGLGLGTCQIAAFFDDEINDLLGVDGENESALYLTAVGRSRAGAGS